MLKSFFKLFLVNQIHYKRCLANIVSFAIVLFPITVVLLIYFGHFFVSRFWFNCGMCAKFVSLM